MIKKPVMMSFTKLCAPKPIANPAIPAPASNPVTFIFKEDKIPIIAAKYTVYVRTL